jgi:flagellar basal-body rod protein FlgB
MGTHTMTSKIDDAFRFHAAALGLRAERQQLLASNIANADTPNYKARDIDFGAALTAATGGAAAAGAPAAPALARTSPRHLAGAAAGALAPPALYRLPAQSSVDGNTVEMDAERAQFAENALHYEADLDVLGMQIKQLLSAIQG